MAESDQEALRAEAEDLVCRTVQVTPELALSLLWGLAHSERHRTAILAGEPAAGALAALLAILPEARAIFEASPAGRSRLEAADGADVEHEDVAADFSPTVAALALRVPAEALPVLRRMIGADVTARHLAGELGELWRELAPFMGDADEDDA